MRERVTPGWVCFVKPSEHAHCTAMAQQGPIVVNDVLCYIRGVSNTSRVRQIHEALISLFNAQKLLDVFHLYRDHRGKGLILRGRIPAREADKMHFGLNVEG